MPLSRRLALHGDYDVWRRDELRADLERLDLTGDITIDLTRTTLMDAGSAALLIALRSRLRQRKPNAKIVLLNAPRIVRRVLELCGASDLFEFSTDR